jgi:hypothetical protein
MSYFHKKRQILEEDDDDGNKFLLIYVIKSAFVLSQFLLLFYPLCAALRSGVENYLKNLPLQGISKVDGDGTV